MKMSTIKDKIVGVFDDIVDLFKVSRSAIEKVVKKNEDYIDAELKVVKKSEEGIAALKEFAKTETHAMNDAISSLAETYETLENARRDKVDKLKWKFLKPLKELVLSFDNKERELKEAKKAEKRMNKAKNKLEKEKAKPEEEKDEIRLNSIEADYEDALKDYQREENEADIAISEFRKEKLETLKRVLINIVEIQKEFHETMINKIKKLEDMTSAINIGDTFTSQEPSKEIEREV